MTFIYSYNNKHIKKICNFKIIKKLDNKWHSSNHPSKVFLSKLNNRYIIIKKINLNKINKILYYNPKVTDIYEYLYNNCDKHLIKHLFKIYYIYNCNHIQYNIIKYYKYNFSDYNNIILNDYRNILSNLNIFLFYLNNKLHIYHNDLYVYAKPNTINLNNIMFYNTTLNYKLNYKLHDNIKVEYKISKYIPVLIDFDASDKEMIKRNDINNINKHMFQNKIKFESEIIFFNTCCIIKYLYNQSWLKSKKFNKNRVVSYVKNIILYIHDYILSKNNINSKIDFEAYFVKYINKNFIKIVNRFNI